MGDVFNDWRAGKKALRAKYGIDCPMCRQVRPRASPTLLLPQQRCKVDGYVDPRPRLSDAQFQEETGFRKVSTEEDYFLKVRKVPS
ncbi:MAG: hypothetical protein ACYDD1_06840 [Caulobacteraceae bacterium]